MSAEQVGSVASVAAVRNALPLAGVRIVDCSRFLPCSYATQLLSSQSDSGAAGTAAISEVGAVIASRSLSDWEGAFAGRDACVTPVRTIEEAVQAPDTARRGVAVAHPDGQIETGFPAKFSETPPRAGGVAPQVGADDEWLAALS